MCSLVASNLHLETKGVWFKCSLMRWGELSAIIFWLISLSVCETAGSCREENYSPPSLQSWNLWMLSERDPRSKKKKKIAQFLKFISKSIKRVKVLIFIAFNWYISRKITIHVFVCMIHFIINADAEKKIRCKDYLWGKKQTWTLINLNCGFGETTFIVKTMIKRLKSAQDNAL